MSPSASPAGLVAEALAAHGGLNAWRARDEVVMRLHCGGLAFTTRGWRQGLGPVTARVATSGQHVVFEGVGTWAGERASRRPRWSAEDFLAFCGSALWTYVSFPFVLAEPPDGLTVTELPGRRIVVTVGETITTHAHDHVLHLDATGLIRRHDYTPTSFGPLAAAANIVLRHDTSDGLTLATRRRVVPRAAGRPLPGPTLVWIELDPLGS